MITFDKFISKYLGKKIDLFWGVNFAMFSSRKNNKVFNPIIKFVVVDVVNNLATFKISTYFLFHDKPMFTHTSIRGKWMVWLINKHISIILNSFSTFPVVMIFPYYIFSLTFITAKFSLSRFIMYKFLLTIEALKTSFAVFIITTSIAKSSFLRWGSIKRFSTLYANILHQIIIAYNALRII